MHDDHERWSDSVAPYLLGALPEDELEAFEAHLAHCADCREEVDVLVPAVHALPASVEPMAPPPALKARIMAEVEREASLLAAAGPEADRPPARERRRRWHFSMPRLAPLAAAAALLFVGVGDRHRRHRSSAPTRRRPSPPRSTTPWRRAPAPSCELADGTATLIAHGLPPAPDGPRLPGVAQAAGRGARADLRAVHARARTARRRRRCPGPLDGVEQMMVTDEPAGRVARAHARAVPGRHDVLKAP